MHEELIYIVKVLVGVSLAKSWRVDAPVLINTAVLNHMQLFVRTCCSLHRVYGERGIVLHSACMLISSEEILCQA